MPSPKSPAAVQQVTQARPKKAPESDAGVAPAVLINRRIAELQDWRGELLAQLRAIITSANEGVVEEWKWNIPVWSCSGILCTGETYKKAVKLTFAKGASLEDPEQLFNASLDGNTRRAIDFTEGCAIKEAALKALVLSAIRWNQSLAESKPRSRGP
ncbi:DUF1801 domain-containing protein [Paucibacter sp. Y2R2-4]|uniref:DUF1801 domain-containing protein n=1 Tax=Paucibacter sp. Y2R2-4 TaxID=2893553 RepID=UPI0021E3A7B8|nr:DUF1801 domain-containing protein [Paucibacter sp. Y2R2-4]MCV2349810.1 DUF1801 domain-containing protein [Paucibacter sp. Y2R2-4]